MTVIKGYHKLEDRFPSMTDHGQTYASNENGYSLVKVAPKADIVITLADDNNPSGQREPQDHLRFTIQKLKQELTNSADVKMRK
ncbi:hypothetical protein SUGI_0016880 [Cryptomeria japonica]|nr:hypothetical protein SUGI_0016880 [Cryptomeria japonica]